MNPRELVDHIRSGPAELVLDKPLRFRRRTRSNPCDFNEFLEALRSSETIRTIECDCFRNLDITEDEWVLLVKTLGKIRDIQHLDFFDCAPGFRDFHPFQVVADAVNSAGSLRTLKIGLNGETFPTRDPSGLIALANSLREHPVLQEFTWSDLCSRLEVANFTALDPVLWALPSCHHLRKVLLMTRCASADAMKNLLQVQPATATATATAIDLCLVLEMEQWLLVADEIRRGRCNLQMLTLVIRHATSTETTEAIKALASAIQLDFNLEDLYLQMEYGFTDEAGVALAEALTVNKTLRTVCLTDHSCLHHEHTVTLGAPAYEAFAAMLRVNTSLNLVLPPFCSRAGDDHRRLESRKQLKIEQRLNKVGRGRLLASRQTTREEYVDALHKMNLLNADDSPAFQVSCLYSLLRLHPAVCIS
jgi:hypothetical protein